MSGRSTLVPRRSTPGIQISPLNILKNPIFEPAVTVTSRKGRFSASELTIRGCFLSATNSVTGEISVDVSLSQADETRTGHRPQGGHHRVDSLAGTLRCTTQGYVFSGKMVPEFFGVGENRGV
jgi:hypothetical protein